MPKTVSQDGVQQRTEERTDDTPVPQVVAGPVEVFKLQFVERTDEKTVEVPQAQFADKTVDTPVAMQREGTYDPDSADNGGSTVAVQQGR